MQEHFRYGLPVLYLSEEETKELDEEYQKIIDELFPNLVSLKQQEYPEIKARYLEGDQEAKEKLINYALKVAFKELKYIYTHRNVVNYDFCDALSDAYIKVINTFEKCVQAQNAFVFRIFVGKNVKGNFNCKIQHYFRRNLDVYNLINGNRRVQAEETSYDLTQAIDEKLENDLLRERLELPLSFLKAKQYKIVKMFYGIDAVEPLSLPQIGEIYNVTASDIGINHTRALKKLRNPMMKHLIEFGGGSVMDYNEEDTKI